MSAPVRILLRRLLFVLVGILLWTTAAPAADFTINRFHADLTVHPDATLTVQEHLEVTFHRPRHGIFRTIPYRYVNELGRTTLTPLSVLTVTDDARQPLPYQVTREYNEVKVRIGDPKTYVQGRRAYIITYTVANALLFLPDHDELYWNVTGNQWPAVIQQASATVTLEAAAAAQKLTAACYTGVMGSRQTQCTAASFTNRADFTCQTTLNPGEGFTIALGWNKGLIPPPSAWQRFWMQANLAENWVFVLPLISFGVMFQRWRTSGRDAGQRQPVTVMYEPPEHDAKPLHAAEVGALVDETMDSRDINAAIIGLAVKGYLKIEATTEPGWLFDSTAVRLIKIHDARPELSRFETNLLDALFSSQESVTVASLNNNFYRHLEDLKTTLDTDLVRKGYFTRGPEAVRRFYRTIAWALVGAVVLLAVFVTPASTGKSLLAGLLTVLPVFLLGRYMPARTAAGAAAYNRVLGFQEFLNRAEKDQLERLHDPSLFTRFLPYAMALGVVDNWAQAFAGIFQEPPTWYSSPGLGHSFNPYVFSRSLDTVNNNLNSALYSSPRSSSGGSGGGGSSGGGFGGGGGGSW